MRNLILLIMATFYVGCNVVIGNYRFTQVNKIEVTSTWKEPVDNATITLPLLKGKVNPLAVNESLADKFKAGDKVSVNMIWTNAYSGRVYDYKEFVGFVKRVNPNDLLELECEDYGYLLRKFNMERTFKNTTLSEVLQFIVDSCNDAHPNTPIILSSKIPEVKFDKFRLDNCNGLEALDQIKETYGLVSFFIPTTNELFVGLAYTHTTDTVQYSLAYNVVDSNLTYRRKDDMTIKLKAIAVLKDNKQITVEIGDKNGEQRTQFYYGISDEETLKKVAEPDLEKLKFEGYEGSFDAFLVPFVQHSMIADLMDPDYEIRHGSYLVDEVKTTLEPSSIFRTIVPGKRTT